MPKTITATVDQVGPSTGEGSVRDHRVLIDRPEAKGGTDRGPMGGELLLLGLGGCFMSNLLAAIRARDAAVSNAVVHVEADIDGPPERMTAFRLTVTADCDDEELLRHLATIAERGCLVSNTLAQAAPLTVEVRARATSA